MRVLSFTSLTKLWGTTAHFGMSYNQPIVLPYPKITYFHLFINENIRGDELKHLLTVLLGSFTTIGCTVSSPVIP